MTLALPRGFVMASCPCVALGKFDDPFGVKHEPAAYWLS